MNEKLQKQPAKTCWFFHKWTKWVRHERPMIYLSGTEYKQMPGVVIVTQRRECITCGIAEERTP